VQQFEQNQFGALSLLCGAAACVFAVAQAGLFAIGFALVAVCCGSYGVEHARRKRADAIDPDSVPVPKPAAIGFGLGLLAFAVYVVLVSFF